ncbi:MAG: AmmeMemoRadiSam system protein A [Armatimonadota bacterium]|nr:MAG: AmmeMemoRadiSam system protein A [Armatimonadota bacterium]
MLTARQHKALLQVAREAVEAAAKNMPYAPTSEDPALQKPGAAFVTLRKRGQLRGCIGTVEAKEPLLQNVANMARAAAREDFRFEPIHLTELPDLEIQISILTPPSRVADVADIEVGVHGLIIQQGGQRGLLLPQVPVEWGWDRDEFLDQTCVKAGLPPGAWRRGADIYAFAAEVFGEED